MHDHDVAPGTLMQLCAQAMVAFLGQAERFEAESRAGVWKTICGEPVADLNYLLVMRETPEAIEAMQAFVADLDGRGLPFCCMLAPGKAEGLKPACEASGLVYAVDWPLMVCPAETAEAVTMDGVDVVPVRTEDDARGMVRVLSGAFHMPEDSTARALPLATALTPGLTIFVARADGQVVSTVTATRHGQVVGIWAMGTPPDAQGKGYGKVLLSQVMARYRDAGVEAFFLGATPAGRPLYEKLGYREVARAQVWVRGETSQA